MLYAVLFTIAQILKNNKYPGTDELIEKHSILHGSLKIGIARQVLLKLIQKYMWEEKENNMYL